MLDSVQLIVFNGKDCLYPLFSKSAPATAANPAKSRIEDYRVAPGGLPMRPLIVVFLVFAGLYPAAQALAGTPDYARERRIANEIVEAILDGEPVVLQAENREFLGIHTRSVRLPARGAVIILHGRGMHPDWGEVVQPLRVGLSESGWDTLSLQLPVLANGAKYYDYVEIFDRAHPRIEAAIARFLPTQPPGW